MEPSLRITVATTTYNRAHTLPRLYESLRQQTCRAFEWVLIDDGSTDATAQLAHQWREEAALALRYIPLARSGRTIAFNRAVRESRGQFFINVDSDDWLLPHSLERLLDHWDAVPPSQRARFAGITARCGAPDGSRIGTPLPRPVVDATGWEVGLQWGVRGDMTHMVQTKIIRRFPLPIYPGEAFVPEGLMWLAMGREYCERFVDEVLYIADYQADGLSAQNLTHRLMNIQGTVAHHHALLRPPCRLPWRTTLFNYARYMRFATHAGISVHDQLRAVPSLRVGLLVWPLAMTMYVRDRLRPQPPPT